MQIWGQMKIIIIMMMMMMMMIIINENNNNNNEPSETRKYWVDVQRGIVSSQGERDPL